MMPAASEPRSPAPARRAGLSFLLGMALAVVVGAVAWRVAAPQIAPRSEGAERSAAAAPASDAPASDAAASDAAYLPASAVAAALPGALPDGVAAAGVPVAVGGPAADGSVEFRVPVAATEARYRVPRGPLRLPPSAPPLLRAQRSAVVVHPDLPPGVQYLADEAREVVRAGEPFVARWRVRPARSAAGGVEGAAPLEVPGFPAADAGSVLVSAGELARLEEARTRALSRHAEAAQQAAAEVEADEARRLAAVPPPCAGSVESMLQEVMEATSLCPRVRDAAGRDACYARREAVNRQMGACIRQNERRTEGLAAARRASESFRRARLRELAARLGRTP